MTSMNKKLERNLVKKVRDYIVTTFKQRAWLRNLNGSAMQSSGAADLIVLLDGIFIAIEFKREDGKGVQSQVQKLEQRKIERAGGIYYLADNYEDTVTLLNNISKQKELN